MDNLENDIKDALKVFLDDSKIAVKGDLKSVAEYTAATAKTLARHYKDADFDEQVKVARDSVALYATTVAVIEADATDARLKAFLLGVLQVGAGALVRAV